MLTAEYAKYAERDEKETDDFGSKIRKLFLLVFFRVFSVFSG